ncbi:MAG: hypothetical protein WKF78_09385 [Candidatus Limnocylindrales bacterium]
MRGSGCGGDLEEATGGEPGVLGQLGRQDEPGLHVQVAPAVALEAGQALAGQPERPAVLGTGRDRQDDLALGRADRHVAAQERLFQGQRQLSVEVGAASGEDGVRELADDDMEVAAARRLAGQPDPAAGVALRPGSSLRAVCRRGRSAASCRDTPRRG